MQVFLAELPNAEVSGAASNALCQLCEECGAKLAPFLDSLMALYQRVTSAGQASTSESRPPFTLEEDSIQQAGPLQLLWHTAYPDKRPHSPSCTHCCHPPCTI